MIVGFIVRYGAAILVSCVTWCIFGFLGFMAWAIVLGRLASSVASDSTFGLAQMVGSYVLFSLTGFSGVFVGSLCLSRDRRKLGSMLISMLGLIVFRIVWLCIPNRQDGPDDIPETFFDPHGPLWPYCAGLLVAVILFLLRRPPNKSPEPTAGVAAVGSNVASRRWLSFFR
jgi:Na+-driven multidrug efflux pump